MQDRVPLYPGRVTLTPVSGQENTYDMVRADQPTQNGTPLNKATLLKDETAALFGLGTDAVPDEVFDAISKTIPSPYGVLAFRVLDTNGTPRQVACAVSPDIVSGSVVYTDADGWFRGLALPGRYTIDIIKSVFVTEASSAQQVTVAAGSVRKLEADFSITFVEHNTVKITESIDKLYVPGDILSIDLFGVGGGASGAAGGGTTTNILLVAGGGSGYTTTVLGSNFAKKYLSISIGAGGLPANVNYTNDYRDYTNGNKGGDTYIDVGEFGETTSTRVLTAKGAASAQAGYDDVTYVYYLGKGGSCGGGGSAVATDTSILDGAADGNSNNKGEPQGTTTRAFGEADGELFASGGGGASVSANYAGVGGEGAGDAKKVTTSSSTSKTVTGDNATTYGSGGGAALGRATSNIKHSLNATSGAGMQGLVMLRW